MGKANIITPVVESNAAIAQAEYSLSPDFNFGGNFESNTPSRTLRSTTTTENRAVIEAKTQTEFTCTAITSDQIRPAPTKKMLNNIIKTLEEIVPMTIHFRSEAVQRKCVASKVKKPRERCSYKNSGDDIAGICWDLSRCDVEMDSSKYLDHVDRLVQAAMCGIHQKVAASNERQRILGDLATDYKSLTHVERSIFQAWMDAIETGRHIVDLRALVFQENTASMTCKTGKSRKSAAPSTASTASGTREQAHTAGFVAYLPKKTKNKSISDALLEEIEKPLGKLALKDGFIYVFWDKEHFGKVKIGLTKDLEARLKQWDNRCNRKHSYHPVSKREVNPVIPHVQRVERLIHTELKDCRKQRYCERCKQDHIEWFEAGEVLVTEIVHKWQDWIMQRPYALDAKTGEWVLTCQARATLAQVCEPVVPFQKPLPPRRTSGASHGKSQRKSKRRTI